MPEALKQCETRRYWAVVTNESPDGGWYEIKRMLETEADGYQKLRWLRRWHPNAFLVLMEMRRVDSELQPREAMKNPMNRDPESRGPQSSGRPQLRLVSRSENDQPER